jgi:hypothetical protein
MSGSSADLQGVTPSMAVAMTLDELTHLKRKIMARSVPSSGDDLEGMVIDFQHSLEQSRLLTQMCVKKTGDPGCMIEATCQPAANTLTIPEIIAEIERLWMEELRYQHFEAHAVGRADYDVTLDFITLCEHGSFYVTGSIAVDVSKIQGPIRAVSFWYRLVGRGSSEASLYDGVNRAFLSATYLSDALRDLANAVIALFGGAQRSNCSWQEEPGEYRWVFNREGEHLRINILWFEDTFSRELDGRGKLVYSTECELRRFACQLRDQLCRLLEEHGLEGYRQNWVNYDFPISEYRKLEEILASEGAASA